MANHLVKDYVDAAIVHLRRMNLMRRPGGVPEAMGDTSIEPSGDWIGWKPVASTVKDEDLNVLEAETRLAFPPIYRDFLKYLHFAEVTAVGIEFEPHLCVGWQDALRGAYFRSWPREYVLDAGLLPFGSETMMDAGPVCFDTRRRMADGDCP